MGFLAFIVGMLVVTLAFTGIWIFQRRRYQRFVEAATRAGLTCRFRLGRKAEFGVGDLRNPIFHPVGEGTHRGRPVIVSPSTPGLTPHRRVALRARLQSEALRHLVVSKRNAEAASEIGRASALLAQYAAQGDTDDTVGHEDLDARYSILTGNEKARRALTQPVVAKELASLADTHPNVSIVGSWLTIEGEPEAMDRISSHLDRVVDVAGHLDAAGA